jgi:hypothetical protein
VLSWLHFLCIPGYAVKHQKAHNQENDQTCKHYRCYSMGFDFNLWWIAMMSDIIHWFELQQIYKYIYFNKSQLRHYTCITLRMTSHPVLTE